MAAAPLRSGLAKSLNVDLEAHLSSFYEKKWQTHPAAAGKPPGFCMVDEHLFVNFLRDMSGIIQAMDKDSLPVALPMVGEAMGHLITEVSSYHWLLMYCHNPSGKINDGVAARQLLDLHTDSIGRMIMNGFEKRFKLMPISPAAQSSIRGDFIKQCSLANMSFSDLGSMIHAVTLSPPSAAAAATCFWYAEDLVSDDEKSICDLSGTDVKWFSRFHRVERNSKEQPYVELMYSPPVVLMGYILWRFMFRALWNIIFEGPMNLDLLKQILQIEGLSNVVTPPVASIIYDLMQRHVQRGLVLAQKTVYLRNQESMCKVIRCRDLLVSIKQRFIMDGDIQVKAESIDTAADIQAEIYCPTKEEMRRRLKEAKAQAQLQSKPTVMLAFSMEFGDSLLSDPEDITLQDHEIMEVLDQHIPVLESPSHSSSPSVYQCQPPVHHPPVSPYSHHHVPPPPPPPCTQPPRQQQPPIPQGSNKTRVVRACPQRRKNRSDQKDDHKTKDVMPTGDEQSGHMALMRRKMDTKDPYPAQFRCSCPNMDHCQCGAELPDTVLAQALTFTSQDLVTTLGIMHSYELILHQGQQTYVAGCNLPICKHLYHGKTLSQIWNERVKSGNAYVCSICYTRNSRDGISGSKTHSVRSIHSPTSPLASMARFFPFSNDRLSRIVGGDRTIRDIALSYPQMGCGALLQRDELSSMPDAGLESSSSSSSSSKNEVRNRDDFAEKSPPLHDIEIALHIHIVYFNHPPELAKKNPVPKYMDWVEDTSAANKLLHVVTEDKMYIDLIPMDAWSHTYALKYTADILDRIKAVAIPKGFDYVVARVTIRRVFAPSSPFAPKPFAEVAHRLIKEKYSNLITPFMDEAKDSMNDFKTLLWSYCTLRASTPTWALYLDPALAAAGYSICTDGDNDVAKFFNVKPGELAKHMLDNKLYALVYRHAKKSEAWSRVLNIFNRSISMFDPILLKLLDRNGHLNCIGLLHRDKQLLKIGPFAYSMLYTPDDPELDFEPERATFASVAVREEPIKWCLITMESKCRAYHRGFAELLPDENFKDKYEKMCCVAKILGPVAILHEISDRLSSSREESKRHQRGYKEEVEMLKRFNKCITYENGQGDSFVDRILLEDEEAPRKIHVIRRHPAAAAVAPHVDQPIQLLAPPLEIQPDILDLPGEGDFRRSIVLPQPSSAAQRGTKPGSKHGRKKKNSIDDFIADDDDES